MKYLMELCDMICQQIINHVKFYAAMCYLSKILLRHHLLNNGHIDI